jgi:hypothetical protein
VDAAVDALLLLETDLERDMVRRAVHQRTGGGLRVRFTVASRKGGGPKRHTRLPKKSA